MAATAAQKRSSATRRAKPLTPNQGKKSAAKLTSNQGKKSDPAKMAKNAPKKTAKNISRAAKVTKAAASTAPAATPKGLAKVVARKALKVAVRKAVQSSAAMIRQAADRAAEAGKSAVESRTRRRPPIQFGVNVAVPIDVVWEEWLSYGSLPEGVQRIEDVERDGEVLIGRTAGPRGVDWEAEITDERENESFAWRSVAGTDCAGLVTFHRLGDRLTRIELDLDVLPTNPAEALSLATHVADRRALTDLRKFKAHVEFISPDEYETADRRNGTDGSSGQHDEDAQEGEDEE